MPHQTKQLKNSTIWFMIGVALFYDALQALLDLIGIGWVLIPIAYLHFWMWFKFHGIDFFTAKRAGAMGLSAVLETVTLGIIPAMTFLIARIAFDHKIKNVVGI